jgi:hypothetical protein
MHEKYNIRQCFEKENPREMFTPMQAKGVWRIRYNEIYQWYDDVALSTFLHLERLKFASHVARMMILISPER